MFKGNGVPRKPVTTVTHYDKLHNKSVDDLPPENGKDSIAVRDTFSAGMPKIKQPVSQTNSNQQIVIKSQNNSVAA